MSEIKYWSDIDWQRSSTERLFHALSDAIKAIQQEIDEAEEDYQIERGLDHTENLLGIAFIVAQTYIVGVVSETLRIVKPTLKPTKESLLRDYSDQISGSSSTQMELCNAIANYFKHHDEWANWSVPGRHRRTVAVLVSVGIQEDEAFPCAKAAEILSINSADAGLEPLLTLITQWRQIVIQANRRE